ncbi:MAG: hypothetical protein MUE71_10445 [Chitinophagaceae bacterium]|nr:hypothetical protein [Chitinophagaceae bacterium]
MPKAIVKYGLPGCIVLVFAAQFYQVHYHRLSRWKGGGFGMYSEVHPKHRQVWLDIDGKKTNILMDSATPKVLQQKAFYLPIQPSPEKLKAFASLAAEEYKADTVSVQIWQPRLNTANNHLTMQMIAEGRYEQKP